MEYVIAAIPRTGSTLLCNLLTGIGVGHPREHLNPDVPASDFAGAVAQRVSTESFLDAARKNEDTGTFGTKLMIHWLPAVAACCERQVERTDLLRHLFPSARFIYLRRRDLVATAASYTLAYITGAWQGPVPAIDIPAQQLLEPMHRYLLWLRRCESDWQSLFRAAAIAPFELWYEDLIDAPEAAMPGVLRHVGHPIPKDGLQLQAEATGHASDRRQELCRLYKGWLADSHSRFRVLAEED